MAPARATVAYHVPVFFLGPHVARRIACLDAESGKPSRALTSHEGAQSPSFNDHAGAALTLSCMRVSMHSCIYA
jgi:hypothetical protein